MHSMTGKPRNILPTSTDIPRSGIPYSEEEVSAKKPARSAVEVFREARVYLENYQTPSRFHELEKRGWEIIPYMIVSGSYFPLMTRDGVWASIRESIRTPQVFTSEMPGSPRIIHMARKRNPSPNAKKPADDWLLEWMWPLDAPHISAKIVGVDPIHLGKGWSTAAKSLGAGTVLQFDSASQSYIVLATRYPNYPKWSLPNIQTPYSAWLDTPEFRYFWEKYLSELISQGERDLMTLDTKNTPIVADMTLVKALIYVENMHEVNVSARREDRNLFFAGESQKISALLGANTTDAFNRGSHAWAKGIIQITNNAYLGHPKATWGRRSWLRDEYIHPAIPMEFPDMTKSHRASLLIAYGHLDRQLREYRDHSDPSAYEWLVWVWKSYAPYILAAGYNSNNTGRVGDLLIALRWHPSPEEVMKRFYQSLTNKFPEETRGYMKKLEYVMKYIIKSPIADLPID